MFGFNPVWLSSIYKTFLQPVLPGMKKIYCCPCCKKFCFDENELDADDENSVECGQCKLCYHWKGAAENSDMINILFYVTGHWWSLYDSSILSKPFSSFYDSMKYMSWNNKICPKLLKIRECSWKLSNFFNLKGRTLLKDFSIWKTTIFHNFCSSRKDLKQFLILTKHAVIWVWKSFFLVEGEITKFK